MEIIPETLHRTLKYVDLVNKGGANPSTNSVDQFYESNSPRVTSAFSRLMEDSRIYLLGGGGNTAEAATVFMARLGWIRPDYKSEDVQLTAVGRALVRGLEIEHDSEPNIVEIVLDSADPFAYSLALTALHTEGPATLVDPYLKPPQLIDLAQHNNIDRFLIGLKLKPAEQAGLIQAAKVIREDRPTIELRKSSAVHDRYLIPRESGQVLMLGGSLNTVGRKLTTLTKLSLDGSAELRKTHERYWRDAEPLLLDDHSNETSTDTTE